MTDKKDFTQGSIPLKMLRFMIPILGALILQAMYTAVDLLIVGQFGTKAGISGVSTGSNIVNMVTFTVSGLAMGVTVLIGHYLGAGENDRVGKVIGGAIAFFLALAAALTILVPVLAEPIARLMQAPPEALEHTVLYIRICGFGIVCVIAYNLISSIFRGMGDSKLPLIFVAIACGVNIIGDLILVAGFHLDVVGAAAATITAQAVSVILSLVIIRKQKLPFRLTKKDIRFSPEIKKFVGIGTPMAFQEILTNVSFLAICAFINAMGLDESSGYGVAQRLQGFIMLVPSSIMQSMSAFVSQNVGAGREDRAKSAMKWGMLFGSAVGIVVASLTFFFGDAMSSIFNSDPEVIRRSFEFLRGFSLDALLTAFLFSFMGYFNGHSRTLFVMIQGLAQSFLVRLPMSYIMSIQPDATLTGIGLAAPTATVFGIVLCFIYYINMNRKKPVLKQPALPPKESD